MMSEVSYDRPLPIPAQVRAARALLGWSQRDLAREAKIAVSTVADFERGQRVPVPQNMEAIRDALTAANIALRAGGAVTAAARFRAPCAGQHGQPIRLIDATDLDRWSDRRDAQEMAPELISRLIRAEAGTAATLRFPSSESVQFRGWDGTCKIETGTSYIPEGRSVWEVSTAKQPAKKIYKDFTKRSSQTATDEQSWPTLLLVTTRRLPDKEKHAKALREKSCWRHLQILDSDDLVHWIELHPAAGNWLAVRIAKRPEGILQLDDIWEEWACSTRPTMSTDLTLVGRDEDAAKIHRWLQGQPAVISMQGETIQEAIAFLYAAIEQFPIEDRTAYFARTVVATSDFIARKLGDGSSSLILILTEPEAGLAQRLAAREHHVYAAYGADANALGELHQLARPPRAGIEWALKNMLKDVKLPEAEAGRYALDSGRSLSALRRLIPSAPSRDKPAWATPPMARSLIPALLAGAWNEVNTADQTALGTLHCGDFNDFIGQLAPIASALDSPLRKIGSAWKLASPRDAWLLLAPHLTHLDLERFAALAIDILGTSETDTAQSPRTSELLRSGIAQTLAVISIYPQGASVAPNAAEVPHYVVRALLQDADGGRWLAVGPILQKLGEASPRIFLDCLERSLKQPDRPVMALFSPNLAKHTGLLWALETLAWDPELLPDVAACLALLSTFDPPNSRFANRPSNSLYTMFALWAPQTAGTLTQRLKVIDGLRRYAPDSAWNLMIELVPGQHETLTPSPYPRWRDYPTENPEPITYGLIARGANEILDRLLDDVGGSASRWCEVINLLPKMEPERRKRVIGALRNGTPKFNSSSDRAEFLRTLRHMLRLHREIVDADWALPEHELKELQQIYESHQSADPVEQCLWLFQNAHIELIDPYLADYHDYEVRLEEARKAAVEQVVAKYSVEGLWRLADNCGLPYFVGIATSKAKLESALVQSLVADGLTSQSLACQEFACGILSGQLQQFGEDPALAHLETARRNDWAPDAIIKLFLCMSQTRRVWELLLSFGPKIENLYWSKVSILWHAERNIEDIEFGIRRLICAKRAGSAVGLVHRLKSWLPNKLIVDVLNAAAKEPDTASKVVGGHTMWEWYVQELLKHLDKTASVDEEQMAQLELAYLPILRFASVRPGGRAAKVLHRRILSDPSLFAQLISDIYQADPKNGVPDQPVEDFEVARTKATRGYELLTSISGIPGWNGSTLDADELEKWVTEARKLCEQAGRAEVGDAKIGAILAKSPADADGVWPAVPVREIVEGSMSRRLVDGIQLGRYNARGVTTRLLGAGGDLERDLAKDYRQWSRATRREWPRTSAMLERMAQRYDAEARWEDQSADALDWRD